MPRLVRPALVGILATGSVWLTAQQTAHADPTWAMTVTPTSVEPGASLTVAAFTPCPESPPAVGVHVVVMDGDTTGTPSVAYRDVPPVDGQWTAGLSIPADVPYGHHLLVDAWCNAEVAGSGQVTARYARVTVSVPAAAATIPDPVDDSFAVRQDTALPINADRLVRNDPQRGWTCRLSQPTHGHLATGGGSGEWTYTPARGFHGRDAFTYRLCDLVDGHEVASDRAATVRITVAPPADPRPAPGNGSSAGGGASSGSASSGSASDPGTDRSTSGGDPTGADTSDAGPGPTSAGQPALTVAAAPRHHHGDDSWGIVILGVAAALVCVIAAWGTWYWRRTHSEAGHVLR